ncbi:hypothetical protein Tco_1032905 [Tanacetum coccineum]|uniref:Retrotransposon protein, putative, Ty1-copia subclass n=1 Tax=Tanacetum coccineum TaxID=301880 RepID=A0ABQ5GDY9_9ASTR
MSWSDPYCQHNWAQSLESNVRYSMSADCPHLCTCGVRCRDSAAFISMDGCVSLGSGAVGTHSLVVWPLPNDTRCIPFPQSVALFRVRLEVVLGSLSLMLRVSPLGSLSVGLYLSFHRSRSTIRGTASGSCCSRLNTLVVRIVSWICPFLRPRCPWCLSEDMRNLLRRLRRSVLGVRFWGLSLEERLCPRCCGNGDCQPIMDADAPKSTVILSAPFLSVGSLWLEDTSSPRPKVKDGPVSIVWEYLEPRYWCRLWPSFRHGLQCFAMMDMKDLGEAAFILGIKIYRDRSKRLIGLCQNAYMDKILKRYKMDNSKRGHIPMQERLDLNKSQGAQTPKEVNRMKNVPYASAVGSIMYAVRCTRPDVAFAQNMTSRFQQNPGEPHWTAVKNILKYLRNTKDMFLVYGGNPSTELRVECYCDAGFETDRDDTKSQTGYVFVLNGGAVDWKSSKQSTTAMSATESEYIAASEAAMEAVWIRKFISGLGIVPTINEPLNMYCDNSAAVHYANEPGVQKGARHYQRRYHYVRECVELGEIRILKVHTDNNLADPFTKALSNRKLTQHARGMGLRPASSFM